MIVKQKKLMKYKILLKIYKINLTNLEKKKQNIQEYGLKNNNKILKTI